MNFITTQAGTELFERITEITGLEKLSSKERIPKLRIVLEDLFKELTSDENRFFSTLHSRELYIFKTYNPPYYLQQQAKSLRILSNKVVHENNFKVTEQNEATCIKTLCETVAHFSRSIIPEGLDTRYVSTAESFPSIYRPQSEKLSTFLIIEDISYNEERNIYNLVCDAEDLDQFTLTIYPEQEDNKIKFDLSLFGKQLKKFCRIYITGIKKNSSKESHYDTTPSTCIVIEPDYLVDVKELSECFQIGGANPLIYLLNRFSPIETSPNMIIGIVVGSMLDDIVTNKENYSFDTAFEKASRSCALSILVNGYNGYGFDENFLRNIKVNAQSHENTIKRMISEYYDHQFILEPTFISEKYGLLGRLDILTENRKDHNKKDIIELKSGNYPGLQWGGLYPNHEAQTLCYDLLLEKPFPKRIGINYILYSKARTDELPLRTTSKGDKISDIQRLLYTRNEIVLSDLDFSDNIFEVFEKFTSPSFGKIPKFSESFLNEFDLTFNALTPVEKEYFLGYCGFIARELRSGKIGNNDIESSSSGFSSLWTKTIDQKKEKFNILENLEIFDITDDFHVFLRPKVNRDLFKQDIISDLRNRDIALLFPQPINYDDNPTQYQILKCTIVEIKPSQIEISLNNKQLDKSYLKNYDTWILEHDFRDNSKILFRSIYKFISDSDSRKKGLLFGNIKPEFEAIPEIKDGSLNIYQIDVVKRAISAKDYFIIQGPPGTGKTSIILKEIIRHLTEIGQNVAVLAYTNRAVDEIGLKLTEAGIDYLKLGRDSEDNNSWINHISNSEINLVFDRIICTSVLLSTQATFVNSSEILKIKKFDVLIVDEASQLLEPQLVGIVTDFKKFILIGDDRQLPPIVTQEFKGSVCDNTLLNRIGLLNYGNSLFTRLFYNAKDKGWDEAIATLIHQYRMHHDIAYYININHYEGRLQESLPEQNSSIDLFNFESNDLYEQALSTSRVIFVPTKIQRNLNKVNDFEASIAMKFVKTIKRVYADKFDPERTLGIITPFRAQIANIKTRNQNSELNDITIDTVERFQGSEREIIIISFAVKNERQLSFMQSLDDNGVDRKLNVALSRAKKHIIILGCEEVLTKNPNFKKLIDHIKQNHGMYTLE
jgi:DNA replication ATP-dependent helicase Dna2